MLNKKGATSISVVLLVAMALLLVCSASFVFVISNTPSKKIADVRAIEEVYAKEEQLKFFVRQVALEVLNDNPSNDGEFKTKFKEKLQGYTINQNDPALVSLIMFLKDKDWSAEFRDKTIIVKIPKFQLNYYKTANSWSWVPGVMESQIIYTTDLIVDIERK